MSLPNHFVVVFGDPSEQGDPVESGRYTAGESYAPFTVKAGDVLLLYCTEGYLAYPKRVAGVGVVFQADAKTIEYHWMPFLRPLTRKNLEQAFTSADFKKMLQLSLSTRRVFEIADESFTNAVNEHPLLWNPKEV